MEGVQLVTTGTVAGIQFSENRYPCLTCFNRTKFYRRQGMIRKMVDDLKLMRNSGISAGSRNMEDHCTCTK